METPRYDVPLPMTLGEAITIIEDVHNWDYDTDTATALGMFQDEGGLHTPVTLTIFENDKFELAGYAGTSPVYNFRTGTLALCGHDCPLYLSWHDPANLSPEPQQPAVKPVLSYTLTHEALTKWKAISFTPIVFDSGR